MVKTKIICTLGPASSSVTVLRKMMLAGMDVARLNFSHGNHSWHQRSIRLIRRLNKNYRRHIRILQDLEGYRIRVARLAEGKPIELKKKQTLLMTNKYSLAGKEVIPFDYEGRLQDIKPQSFIYIDDGNIALQVKQASRDYLTTQVIVAGTLKENKGINIPGVKLSFKGLTAKDRVDLDLAIREKLDFIAQSFVRNKQDILLIRDFINRRGFDCPLIAKIENREGIKNVDAILDVSDGIMIARGDMGVCLPVYEVPVLQKILIKKCNQRKKPVITATQMLESMTEHLRPTRAETSDVANAIIDGSDYVMLSAETAAGKYPVEAVTMMNNVIKFTEQFVRKN